MPIQDQSQEALARLTMRYYSKRGDTWVKLIALYEDGREETLIDTELDAEVIAVVFNDEVKPKRLN